MNIKQEALFITLSGFAKSCVDLDEDHTLPISKLAYFVNKYFTKDRKKYSKVQRIQVGKYIKEKIEPRLYALGKNSPHILLILTLDRLINEFRHDTARLKFIHFDISKMIDEVYSLDRYKSYIKSHSDFVLSI